jgi:cobalt-zinc-cadmium efflux system outer membrane protein
MQSLALLDGAGASIEAERDDGWSVGPGASVPLPIFDWGDARRSSAEARVIEGRHLLVLARRQAVEEIRRALAELTSTRTLLDQLEQHRIPRLQEHLDLLQSAYEIGEADMVELILAQQRVEEAQAERIELQLNLTLANDRLVRSTGGQSPDREQP